MPKIKITPKKAGQKPIVFNQGTLRAQLGIPGGQNIPDDTMQDAIDGKYGKLAQKRAQFKKNVLTGGK
jgi:hypothetical protein